MRIKCCALGAAQKRKQHACCHARRAQIEAFAPWRWKCVVPQKWRATALTPGRPSGTMSSLNCDTAAWPGCWSAEAHLFPPACPRHAPQPPWLRSLILVAGMRLARVFMVMSHWTMYHEMCLWSHGVAWSSSSFRSFSQFRNRVNQQSVDSKPQATCRSNCPC